MGFVFRDNNHIQRKEKMEKDPNNNGQGGENNTEWEGLADAEKDRFKHELEDMKNDLKKILGGLDEGADRCERLLNEIDEIKNDQSADLEDLRAWVQRLKNAADELEDMTKKADSKNDEFASMLYDGHSKNLITDDEFEGEKNKMLKTADEISSKKKQVNNYEEVADNLSRGR